MKCTTIFSRDNHRWLVFGEDPDRPANLVDTNQLVLVSHDTAMLVDPGGAEIFPGMIAALTREVPVDAVKHIFISHQDPDVGSSLALWRRVCPEGLKVYSPWVWTSFLLHFDPEATITPIPDEGMSVVIGRTKLQLLPAHYLHSSGNCNVYDPAAKLLFTGDIGSALLPSGASRDDLFVRDFNRHVQYMDGFHRRWMGSAQARDAWVSMVARLDIDILAPQHGLMFRGDDVKRFIEWFAKLEIGSAMSSFGQANVNV